MESPPAYSKLLQDQQVLCMAKTYSNNATLKNYSEPQDKTK